MNNSPNSNHRIELALEGTRSNRGAIGAKVKLTAGGRTQWEHVSHAAGYASSSAAPLHFGVGSAKLVDEVEIVWPSGIHQVLKTLNADRIVKIKEPPPQP